MARCGAEESPLHFKIGGAVVAIGIVCVEASATAGARTTHLLFRRGRFLCGTHFVLICRKSNGGILTALT